MKPIASFTINLGDVDADHKLDITGSLTIFGATFELPKINVDFHAAIALVTGFFGAAKDAGKK